jgi:hypothetical protein
MRFIGQRRPPRSFDVLDGPAQRFGILASISGYDVIDYDGSPIAQMPDPVSAQAHADDLNAAAWSGPSTLLAALVA